MEEPRISIRGSWSFWGIEAGSLGLFVGVFFVFGAALFGHLVDGGFGELGEELVGFAFFVEGLLEEFGGLVLAEHFGVGAHGAVAGDFVVFDALSGGDEGGIFDGVFGFFIDG